MFSYINNGVAFVNCCKSICYMLILAKCWKAEVYSLIFERTNGTKYFNRTKTDTWINATLVLAGALSVINFWIGSLSS